MYVLYEESAKFKAAKILSEADTTLQVESASGKRSKVKKNTVVFSFDAPAPAELIEQAQALAATLDIDFLWECAPQDEFDVADFALDYFGHAPSATEKTALLFALQAAPVHFHRRGRGHYRPAPPDILQAAQAAQEKKRLQLAQQQRWVDDMLAGQLPGEIAAMADRLLTRPDKNTLEYKAFETALGTSGKSPAQLLLELGAWPHALALHRQRFFSQYFPDGTDFKGTDWLSGFDHDLDALPLADVAAYSLDDHTTTEIDDALSVTLQDAYTACIGIHVAVPALGIPRAGTLDELARARMTTVYMPGEKIPMLPDALIQRFSLDAGRAQPVLSLYLTARLDSGDILATDTRLERISVTENLRLHQLEADVSETALNDPAQPLRYGDWLRPLWQVTRHLSARRDAVRGKPEANNRTEYNLYLDGAADDPHSTVNMVPRQRNAPLDRIVSEFMIFANSHWGGYLREHGVPGIYRSRQMGRTRMSTHPLPHEAMGVAQYIWATSPLRRYVDLVNQRQILALVQHGVAAKLVAPFKPKDADLFALIGAFDARYAACNDFQRDMENYWSLRWLRQQGLDELEGEFIRDRLVRLNCAPLVVEVAGLPELTRGQRIRLGVLGMDELALTLDCRYLETLELCAS